jgi:hypothetical protein
MEAQSWRMAKRKSSKETLRFNGAEVKYRHALNTGFSGYSDGAETPARSPANWDYVNEVRPRFALKRDLDFLQ